MDICNDTDRSENLLSPFTYTNTLGGASLALIELATATMRRLCGHRNVASLHPFAIYRSQRSTYAYWVYFSFFALLCFDFWLWYRGWFPKSSSKSPCIWFSSFRAFRFFFFVVWFDWFFCCWKRIQCVYACAFFVDFFWFIWLGPKLFTHSLARSVSRSPSYSQSKSNTIIKKRRKNNNK